MLRPRFCQPLSCSRREEHNGVSIRGENPFGINSTIDMLRPRFCQPLSCSRREEHNGVSIQRPPFGINSTIDMLNLDFVSRQVVLVVKNIVICVSIIR
jgi:hypothetical protein